MTPEETGFDDFVRSLLERRHYDFRNYARASLLRRAGVAAALMGCSTLGDLTDRVSVDDDTFRRVLGVLTVPLSEPFRDPGFFAEFRARVVPELRSYPSIKIWVAGCSTGEEALSLAILLSEEDLLGRTLLYATDINPGALDAARRGRYPTERVSGYQAAYAAAGGRHALSRYFVPAGDRLRIHPELQSRIVFADHSLATDQVFSEVQVITCRNVLIYFDKTLQARAVGLFKDALPRRGYFGLGPRETLRFSTHASAFRPLGVSSTWYQRR